MFYLYTVLAAASETCIPSKVKWQQRDAYFMNTTILNNNVMLVSNLPKCVDSCGEIYYNEIVYYDSETKYCVCFNIKTKHYKYSQRLYRNSENDKRVVIQELDESKLIIIIFYRKIHTYI